MKRILLFALGFNFFMVISAQQSFTISKPELSFSENILTIRYDIYGGSNEFVNISLVVLNSKGDTLKPGYISGNIGKGISCGLGKTIKWNMEKDNVKIRDSISVYILGEKFVPQVARTDFRSPETLSRGNVIVSSLFLPGWGQKKASGKKSCFILSGLTYGSIGASLYCNLKAAQYKKDYKASLNATESDNLFGKWQKSYDNSKYFAIGAAGIWALNLVWAAIVPINENAQTKMHVSLNSADMDGLMISARWNF